MRARFALACLLAVALAVPALVVRVAAEQRSGSVAIAVTDSTVAGAGTAESVVRRLRSAGVTHVVVGMRPLRDYRGDGSVIPVARGASSIPAPLTGDGPAVVFRGRVGDPDGAFGRVVTALRAQFGSRVTTAEATPSPGRSGNGGPGNGGPGTGESGTGGSSVDGAANEEGSPSEGAAVPFVRIDGVAKLADLDEVPVGYDLARVRALDAAGIGIVLALPARIARGRGWLEREIDRARTVADIEPDEATDTWTALVLSSPPFPSLAGERAAFSAFLTRRGFTLAFPDFGELPGAPSYAGQLSGRIVRGHVVDVRPGDDPRALVARGSRAVKERTVRLLVLRSALAEPDAGRRTDAVTALAANLRRDLPDWTRPSSTSSGSVPSGSNPSGSVPSGPPTAMPAVDPGPVVSVASLLAALVILAAAGGWIVRTPMRLPAGRLGQRVRRGVEGGWPVTAVGVGLAGGVGVAALIVDSLPLWQLVTLAVAIAGASLAVLVVVGSPVAELVGSPVAEPARESSSGLIVRSYLLGLGIALATGLVVAALGSRTEFLTGLVPFLGVKALLIAPPVVVGLVTLVSTWTPGSLGWRRWVGGVRPLQLVGGAVVLVGVAYYLVRSGNSGLASAAELWLRDALDETLYVRPRFKEALLGFPAMVLAVAWSCGGLGGRRTGWVVCWSVVAGIGTASMVDTFAHFHTPLALSLLRSAYSLVIGLALGLVATWLVRRVTRRSPVREKLR
ncbi:DUF5693 family protein [Actinopolymorpha sp. B9G3]|uniref:DUF5693 family protein n=1 Tax=Actinopolymorpha sp. B9G3 TaxID=3158970 RepID=UPI0032D96804